MITQRYIPWIVVGVFAVFLAAWVLPLPGRPGSGFDVAAFGRLPVSANGRVQPFDSVARTSLLQIRGPVAPIDRLEGPQARPSTIEPTAWLLEVLAKPDAADRRRIFPVSPELAGELELQAASRGTSYHAFEELAPKAAAIQDRYREIAPTNAADRAPWQSELVALREKLVFYERLKNSVAPNTRLQQDAKGQPITFDFAGELARYRDDLAEALRVDAGRRRGSTERLDVGAETRLRSFAALFQVVARTGVLAMVPGPSATGASRPWTNIGSVLVQSSRGHEPPPPVAFFATMTSAFARGEPKAFNAGVAGYGRWLATNGLAPEARKAGFEAFSNLLMPLVRALVLYALALVLLVVAGRTGSATVYRSALAVVLLASALHAAGLLFGTVVAGRPSWIAVAGWAIGVTALVVEAFRRNGRGTAASAAVGVVALVVAYGVTPGGAASLVRHLLETLT